MMHLFSLQERLNTQSPDYVGLDGYPYFADDPYIQIQRQLQQKIDALHLAETPQIKFNETFDAQWLLDLHNQFGGQPLWEAMIERMGWMVQCTSYRVSFHLESMTHLIMHSTMDAIRDGLSRQAIEHTLEMLALEGWALYDTDWASWLDAVELWAATDRLTPTSMMALRTLQTTRPWGTQSVEAAMIGVRMARVVGRLHQPYYTLGWPWVERMHDDLGRMSADRQMAWHQLLAWLPTRAIRPSTRWLNQASAHLHALPKMHVRQMLICWLSRATQKPTQVFDNEGYEIRSAHLMMGPRNETLLRGLVFLAALDEDELLHAVIAEMAVGCHKKVPEIGPMAQRLGRSCIEVLSMSKAPQIVGLLTVVRQAVPYATTHKIIDATLQQAQQNQPDTSDTLYLPTLGLEEDGLWRARFGDWRVSLEVDDQWQVQTRWQRCVETTGQTQLLFLLPGAEDTTKAQKTPPKALKLSSPECVELVHHQTRLMSSTLESLGVVLQGWLETQRQWTGRQLTSDIFAHPLLGAMSRALIWHMDGRGAIAWDRDLWVDARGVPVILDEVPVRLWHGALASPTEREFWRGWVVHRHIKQPIAQVFAPIYDQQTHPIHALDGVALQQQQFHRLARLNQWQYDLQGPWPTEPAATRDLTLGEQTYRVKMWLNPVREPHLKTSKGVFQWVWVDRLEVFDDINAPALDVMPEVLYCTIMAQVDLFTKQCGTHVASDAKVLAHLKHHHNPPHRGFDARVVAHAQWLDMWLAHTGLEQHVQVIHDTLILRREHPIHVDLETGRCFNPQDDFDIHLDDRARRRAQHFIEQHVQLAFEPEAPLKACLYHLVLHIWDLNRTVQTSKTKTAVNQ